MLFSLLTAVGITCLITTLLAALMVVADATIGNYGQVKITINADKERVVDGGKPLLATLKEQEVFIPSACGGRGSCGLCKVKVAEGGGDLLPTETPWLSAEEQAEGFRLACQCKAKADIKLQIPEELLEVKAFQAEVASIVDLTHDIKQLQLKLIAPPTVDYVAGKFMQLEVPEYELTNEPVYRAYSISSAPGSDNVVEFEIRYVPNGICTTYVHQHLQEGDTMTINGPYGDFRLSDTGRDIVCIAGGSGMAPIKSILLDMEEKQINRKTRYFFGARAKRDLFLVDEMKRLESALPDFRFIPALSEPDAADQWEGDTGLITEVVGRHIDDASDMEAYLCGSPFMIDACIKVLTDKGMPESQIFYDKFA